MEQRDYLLRQIEIMTQVLVNLIRRLLGLKDIYEEEVQQTTDEVLKEQLDLSIDKIINTEIDEIEELIFKRKGIHKSNIDLFAEILLINAKTKQNPEQKVNLLNKALRLLEWLDNTENTFSMERHKKMNEIQHLINENTKN